MNLSAIKKASIELRRSDLTDKKNACLEYLKVALVKNTQQLIVANKKDLEALGASATAAFRDRLTLTESRIELMIATIAAIQSSLDPVGEIVETKTLQNGVFASRVRAPFGVVLVVYESRPNVAVDCFALALKSGNAVILRGGKESSKTTRFLYDLMSTALQASGLSTDLVYGVSDPDRELVKQLLQEKKHIDLVIPRGSERLIDFVVSNTQIPVLKNDRGMCHVYIHEDASNEMAVAIVDNAKTQRPGVCNAIETILIHEKKAASILPAIYEKLTNGTAAHPPVEFFCDESSLKILYGRPHILKAMPESFDTEYLDYKLNCKIVRSLNEAIAHIEAHGSKHSEAIVTESKSDADAFLSSVDAACVYWNASTRFTDGFELELGGEIGVSTQKLHVRGPVGLRELTSPRWILKGKGQVRT